MTTPQDSPRRRKQKARRTKQLNEWRIKKATEGAGSPKKAGKAAKSAARPSAASSGASAAKKSK